MSLQTCHYSSVTIEVSLKKCHYRNVTIEEMSLHKCHDKKVTIEMSLEKCDQRDVTTKCHSLSVTCVLAVVDCHYIRDITVVENIKIFNFGER